MKPPEPAALSTPLVPEQLTDELILRFLGGIWRLNRRMKQDVGPLLAERHGIDLRRYFVLQAIHHGHAYPKQLAEALDMPPSLLSRYLEQLVKAGLLERQIDREDSRRIHLTLTDAGQAMLDNISRAIKDSTGQRLGHLEFERLLMLLDTIEALADIGLPASATDPLCVSDPTPTQEPA